MQVQKVHGLKSKAAEPTGERVPPGGSWLTAEALAAALGASDGHACAWRQTVTMHRHALGCLGLPLYSLR